jgi:predicted RNA polymerase sigma factor
MPFYPKNSSPAQERPPMYLEELEIDLSTKNINDSQLAMMFAICHPCISTERK